MADEEIADRHPAGSAEQRALGARPPGMVYLRSFDEGIVRTLRAEVVDGNYWINDPRLFSVEPAPGQPGVPVTFAFPDDNYEHWRVPVLVIRRDDIQPAMNRWHPGMVVSRSPAEGANPLSATVPTGPLTSTVLQGFDRYEVQQQAVPFDLTYTLSIMARHRGFGDKQPIGHPVRGLASPRTQANRLLDYVLRVYQPYSSVFVWDSNDEIRTYECFMEAVSHLDEVAEVTNRMIGFAVTLRVEAELDLSDPQVRAAVRGPIELAGEVL